MLKLQYTFGDKSLEESIVSSIFKKIIDYYQTRCGKNKLGLSLLEKICSMEEAAISTDELSFLVKCYTIYEEEPNHTAFILSPLYKRKLLDAIRAKKCISDKRIVSYLPIESYLQLFTDVKQIKFWLNDLIDQCMMKNDWVDGWERNIQLCAKMVEIRYADQHKQEFAEALDLSVEEWDYLLSYDPGCELLFQEQKFNELRTYNPQYFIHLYPSEEKEAVQRLIGQYPSCYGGERLYLMLRQRNVPEEYLDKLFLTEIPCDFPHTYYTLMEWKTLYEDIIKANMRAEECMRKALPQMTDSAMALLQRRINAIFHYCTLDFIPERF